MEGSERVRLLESRLGIRFSNRETALVALTHKSWINEHRDRRDDNERLEFLGDAVVDLAVSQRLMERLPEAREGTLSRLRASLVDEVGLARVARELGLGDLLFLGRGEARTGGRDKPSVLADAMEAVVAAIYLEGGLPLVLVFVDRFIVPALDRLLEEGEDRDWKTRLQELAQGQMKVTPRYRVVDRHGPDHERTWDVEVSFAGESWGTGSGRSKKEAEQRAARQALTRLEESLGTEGG